MHDELTKAVASVQATIFDFDRARKVVHRCFPELTMREQYRKTNEILIDLVRERLQLSPRKIKLVHQAMEAIDRAFAPLEPPLREQWQGDVTAAMVRMHEAEEAFYDARLKRRDVKRTTEAFITAGVNFRAARVQAGSNYDDKLDAVNEENIARAERRSWMKHAMRDAHPLYYDFVVWSRQLRS
jgi:hypothetical protein